MLNQVYYQACEQLSSTNCLYFHLFHKFALLHNSSIPQPRPVQSQNRFFFYLFSHRQEKLRRRSPSPCTDNERLADTARRLLSTPSSATAQTQHRSRPRRRHVYIDALHGEFISRATSQLRVPSLPTGKSLNLLTNRSLDSLPVAFLQVKETKLINFNFSPPDTYE